MIAFWVAPRRPAFLLDVSSRTLGRVVCDPELKVPRGGVPMDKKTSAIWVPVPCVTLKKVTLACLSISLAHTLKKAPGHVSYFDLLA